MSLKLLSFDVWDTLIIDDSDEIYRKENALPSKKQEREDLYIGAYENGGEFSVDSIINAISLMQKEFENQWKIHHQTPGIRWRLNHIEKTLGKIQKKPFILEESIKSRLIINLEEMELKYPIQIMPGVKDFLDDWHREFPKIKLGIVSDAIYSPGRSIRVILEKLDLLKYFSYFAFSDEVGASKPSQKIFKYLSEHSQTKAAEIVHIGDRFSNDIEGPMDFGSKGVLCQVNKPGSKPFDNVPCFQNYQMLLNILKEFV